MSRSSFWRRALLYTLAHLTASYVLMFISLFATAVVVTTDRFVTPILTVVNLVLWIVWAPVVAMLRLVHPGGSGAAVAWPWLLANSACCGCLLALWHARRRRMRTPLRRPV